MLTATREKLQKQILARLRKGRGKSDVFSRLHSDAADKSLRNDILRKNLDAHIQHVASPKAKSSTSTWRSRWRSSAEAGGSGRLLLGSSGGGFGAPGGGPLLGGAGGSFGSPRLGGRVVEFGRGDGGGSFVGAGLPGEAGAHGTRDKLYRDALERQERLAKRQLQKEEMARIEVAQYSFQPNVLQSQKRVAGVRGFDRPAYTESHDPMRTKTTHQKLQLMRQQKILEELKECSFKPEIDPRSAAMMERRIKRLTITGSLHDHLYEDAKRREERMIEYANLVSPEVTFKPDIGNDKYRPSQDPDIDAFYTRLSTQKAASAGGGAASQGPGAGKIFPKTSQDEHDVVAKMPFHPQTGRPPNFPRNEDGKPIGHFLYEVGQYVRTLKREIVEAKLDEEAKIRSTPRTGEKSKEVAATLRRKRYEELFEVCSKDGICTKDTIDVASIDEKFAEFVLPIKA